MILVLLYPPRLLEMIYDIFNPEIPSAQTLPRVPSELTAGRFH